MIDKKADAMGKFLISYKSIFLDKEDANEIVRGMQNGFEAGANWALQEFKNSLWHDASEEPELKDVIVCCAGKSRERCVIVPQEELARTITIFEEDKLLTKKCTAWEITARCLKVGKWCYVDDILPKEGGEQ